MRCQDMYYIMLRLVPIPVSYAAKTGCCQDLLIYCLNRFNMELRWVPCAAKTGSMCCQNRFHIYDAETGSMSCWHRFHMQLRSVPFAAKTSSMCCQDRFHVLPTPVSCAAETGSKFCWKWTPISSLSILKADLVFFAFYYISKNIFMLCSQKEDSWAGTTPHLGLPGQESKHFTTV